MSVPAKRIVLAAVGLALGAMALPAHAAGTSTLTGTAFNDANRNGLLDAGESVRSGDALYLFDSAGNAVATTTSAANGTYSFPGLAAGSYTVTYTTQAWWSLRHDLVPTTTGSLRPSRTVSVPSGSVDFGWRPVVRSTTAGSPVTSVTGPQGLRVESYDDVVPAQDLYAALLRGNVGAEASSVVVRFDLGTSSTTTTSAGSTNGTYDSFSGTSYVTYDSWLDSGDDVLSHEYGHAWSLYRAYVLRQDPDLTGYLQARGLSGDTRVGSSYEWLPREMVAEDYRQLLGSSTASAYAQTNRDIPPAASVPGLKEYLLGTFSTAGASPTPTPSPSASPTASPSPSPTATPTASPSPSPTASPTASPSPSPTASATTAPRTKGGGCRKPC